MELTRREIIKAQAAAAAAAVAGIALPAQAANVVMPGDEAQLSWSKAPCRFCGTGCGVMVAVKDGQVVATHGDILAEVNRGINCVKGYFLSKIMYGADRLTTPLLRMRDGAYAKDGEFTPVTWDQAFDIMAEKFKAALKAKGPAGVGMFGSGQWTIWEGYAANKLFKAGFRSNNIDPNARHCMASAAFGFMRTFGMDEPMGCYDDIEAADAFVLWGSNMAEMHPVLWTRVTDRRLSYPQRAGGRALDLRAPQLRPGRHPDRVHAADRSGDPQLHRPPHHQDRPGQPGLRGQAHAVPPRQHRHRLRAAAGAPAGAGGRQRQGPRRLDRDELRGVRGVRRHLRRPQRRQAVRRAREPAGGVGRALRRPEDQGHVVLDHGVQPAHARRLGEPDGLQPAPLDRQDQRARQQPVLAHRPALGLRHRARGRHLLAPAAGRPAGDQPRASQARRGDLEAAARDDRGASPASMRSSRAASSRTASCWPTGSSATTTCRPART